MNFETIIGLETHVQLRTESKLFCRCANQVEDAEPNTSICPVCMGHPGTLPVPNEIAIGYAVRAALAMHCTISATTRFDRKSYFYPDLPKGYQISQYADPVGTDGHLLVAIGGKKHRIRIERLHLEEDSAKLVHTADGSSTLVDYNRAGTPLVEIVTKPDIPDPKTARLFLQELRLVMRYIGISDADMEKGHLRCDANISLRPIPEDFDRAKELLGLDGNVNTLFPKTEIKNLNSFRSVERALNYEIRRQTELWHSSKPPLNATTRGWDEKKGVSVEHREKEHAHDYRYFPEPDIPPFDISQHWVLKVRDEMVELPEDKRQRFENQYGMNLADASVVVEDKTVADFFEAVVSELRAWLVALEEVSGTEQEIWEKHKTKLVKLVVGWMTSRLFTFLNEHEISITDSKVTPENFAELITLIHQRRVNSTNAQVILEKMFLTGNDPSDILESDDLGQIEGDGIEKVVGTVVNTNPLIVEQYKAGKVGVLQFLIGKVMKETKGKADPEAIREMLMYRLK
ncbi:MAG: glutaminyl-tRNA synthase (glutamine-hydrolyzing) subunit B [Candidatus Kerfeldbacteria bacterium RIFCSPLOWO2_01_FULL_48_11]|uniref:Aspartyl/glutamyl-tRNA(Asn/Gln) amidotransferase subunit B n=1 Tax=Candidatus Kerfeldbacteria bacterium RIFCSPLOWO2_01_FULL_48_11 TaxID=1798543 RepID=A0A1G2B2I0_9BACT|nr:MAG: glutaminyl-tRNA synthase (glutamine-hydrolyzing) subunit B [Candidatus Kerfeldbacteria bacterium RIFCSPLOWO2_01_FULL_48_11]